MEALELHWLGEPESPQLPRRRRRARDQPPLLSLGFGPCSVTLVPPLPSPEPEAAEPLPAAGPAQPAAAGAPEAPSPVEQLRAALAERDPRIAERLAATGEVLDSAALSRWLTARHGDVEAAAAGLAAHAAWRESFVGAGGVSEASIACELGARKVFLQGCDAQGCPVVVVQAARHDMGRRDLAETKRLIAYVLDSAAATADLGRNPGGRICCLFDLAGLRPRNLDVKALLAIFDMLQHHWPERLDSLYFLNAPLIFWGVWRLVSPFVQPGTKRKIAFIGGAGGRAALLGRMGPAVLPQRYGGAVELVPIDGAMTAWRRQRAAAAAAAAAGSASPASEGGSSGGGRAAGLRRRAGGAARAVHGALLGPVGGAAAGMVRALRRHHQLLLRRHQHPQQPGGGSGPLSEQQRSLLAQVVLTHMLLVGLLLRMLQRVLLRRPAAGAAGSGGGGAKEDAPQLAGSGSPGSAAASAGSMQGSSQCMAAQPAGPADD